MQGRLLTLVLAVHTGHSFAAPRGLLILEAQSKLARFLHDFVTLLLKGVDGPMTEHVTPTLGSGDSHMLGTLCLEDSAWMQFSMTYYDVGDFSSYIYSVYQSLCYPCQGFWGFDPCLRLLPGTFLRPTSF